MDSNVTIKFFRVDGNDNRVPNFIDVLDDISDIKSLAERIRNASLDDAKVINVRLERFKHKDDYAFGEFTRLQTDNIPPEVTEDDLKPLMLSDGMGLGHVAAFRYHVPTQVLALQINPNSITHNSLADYLMRYRDDARFLLAPVVDPNIWEKYDKSSPRTFEIAIASPHNFHALESDDDLVIDALRNFGESVDGHVLNISVSVGRKRDANLNKGNVSDFLKKLIGMRENNTADIRKLKVGTDQKNEAGKYDEINFLRELLVEKTRLDLPSNDSGRNFKIRQKWMRKKMNNHIDYFQEIYD